MKRKMTVVVIVGLSLALLASWAIAQHMEHQAPMAEGKEGHAMAPCMEGGEHAMCPGCGQKMMGRGMMRRGRMGPGRMRRMGRGMPGGMPCGMGGPGGKFLEGPGGPEVYMRQAGELGLSDDQKDRLKEILVSHRKETIQKRADIEVAEVELKELMMPDSPQFDKAKKKVSQIAKMRGEIAERQLDVLQKARNVLTAEQIEKLKSLRKGMKCNPGPMGGPGCKMHN